MVTDGGTSGAGRSGPGAWLLSVLGALQIATVIVAVLMVFGDAQDRVARALARGPVDLGEVGAFVVVAGALVSALVALVVGLASAFGARRLARGGRPARVAGAVGAVLAILWAGGVAVINPAGGPMSLFATFADTNATLTGSQLREQINAALPTWYRPVHIGLAVATVVTAVSVLALLARSGSGAGRPAGSAAPSA